MNFLPPTRPLGYLHSRVCLTGLTDRNTDKSADRRNHRPMKATDKDIDRRTDIGRLSEWHSERQTDRHIKTNTYEDADLK